MQVFKDISTDTVERALNTSVLGKKEKWRIPSISSEFVWRMEDVVDLTQPGALSPASAESITTAARR